MILHGPTLISRLAQKSILNKYFTALDETFIIFNNFSVKQLKY